MASATSAIVFVLALAGCDRVFGIGDPYEDARRTTGDVSDDGAPDVPPLPDASGSGVVAHFSFDTNLSDDSGTYSGVDYGNLSMPVGHRGSGVGFNGSSCLEVVIPQQLATFTIAFWARADSSTGGALVSRGHDTTTTLHSYQVYDSDGAFGFRVLNNTTEVDQVVTGQFPLGAWGHYAVTFDGQLKRWYVNGAALVSQQAGPITYGSENHIDIGCQDNSSSYFVGVIDELYLYNYALSQNEVSALATL